ncbi:MAG: 2'-5' RNA ligase family protein [Patescibacteria group bacterium]
MPYLVVAYPKLDDEDFGFIQNYRKENDARYFHLIDPHITLVFAINDIDEQEFLSEVRKQVVGTKAFRFEIKVATINLDNSGNFYHEFLVPDTGYSNIVKLHNALYADKFEDYLRLDIDFIPHIGIGNSDEAQHSKMRVDDLNTQAISIEGKVSSIDVIEYKEESIRTIEKIKLTSI